MPHYAKVLNGVVTQVLVSEADFFESFVDTRPGEWVQTSYYTRGGVHYGDDGQPDDGEALRYNYAGVGYAYDQERDAFIPPRPYPSWVLDADTCLWAAPAPYPQDGKPYAWDEAAGAWVEVD